MSCNSLVQKGMCMTACRLPSAGELRHAFMAGFRRKAVFRSTFLAEKQRYTPRSLPSGIVSLLRVCPGIFVNMAMIKKYTTMKHLPLLFFLLLVSVSCSSSDNDGGGASGGDAVIECSPMALTADAGGGVYTVSVKCSGGNWTAFPADDCSSWVSVKVSGSLETSGTVEVTVAGNTTSARRSGSVIVKSGTVRQTVTVTQAMPLQVSATHLYPASKGESLELTVTGEGDWSVSSADSWITAVKTNENTVTVTAEPNGALQSRSGRITITGGGSEIPVTVTQESAESLEIVAPEGYVLVWNDEFNEGTTLGNGWTHEVQGSGWVNNELQNYVAGQADGRRVTELKDGRLCINCFKGSDGKVYSARVYANKSVGWKYGYFEARILLPKGKGTWPAFWMMPVNYSSSNPWPDCGEIDIMEEVGVDANVVSSSIHCKAYNHPMNTQKTASRNIGTAESEYHVYACEWTEDCLKFYVDGQVLMTFNNEGTGKDTWPFDTAFYPILNLAWGGDWGGYAGVDESALPVTMKVDYLRIFQKK